MNINYSFHYSNWHSEDSRENDIEYYKHFIDRHVMYPNSQEASVLEIGCGMGNFLTALKRRGFLNIEGIDIDSQQVESSLSVGVKAECVDALEYLENLQGKKFDYIYAFDVLEHMEKSKQLELMRKIFSSLSDTGSFFFSVPNAMAPLGLYFQEIDWTHYNSFSPTSISFLLKNAHFKHFQVRPTHQESNSIRTLKQPWVDLYFEEFGIKSPILTPSFLVSCFKNEVDFDLYLKQAPDLMVFEKPNKSFKQRVKSIFSKQSG